MPMLPVPVAILTRFEAILEKRTVAPILRSDYKKWLRYFLDFCTKYPVPEARPDQVRLFIEKLREKRQTPVQQNQAAHAVSLYFEIQRKREIPVEYSHTDTTTSFIPEPPLVRDRSPFLPQSISPKTISPAVPAQRQPWRLWEDGYAVKSDSPEWDAAIAELAAEIKTRHYSSGSGSSRKRHSRRFRRLKNCGDIIYMKRMSRMRFTRLYAGLNSPSESLLTPSATASPPIFCRPIMISGRSRHYSAIVM